MHTMLLRYRHQFRTLVAEVVREEYGREVVLAGVEEEALEDLCANQTVSRVHARTRPC